MGRHLPAHVRNLQPPTVRVVHYPDPAGHNGHVVLRTEAEVAAWRAANREAFYKGRARLAAVAERDRKVRRFWLGFGAVIAVAFLAGLIAGGWLLWSLLAPLGLGILAVPLLIAGLCLGALGGHRCITIVQHMH